MNVARKLPLALLLLVAVCVLVSPALATGEVSLFLGQKNLSENDLPLDVDKQSEIGILSSWDFGWPVAISVDLLSSDDDDSVDYDYDGSTYRYEFEVETTELAVGVRKSWGEKIRPYVGGGLAMIKAEAELIVSEVKAPGLVQGGGPSELVLLDDDDSDIGFFANAGVVYRIGKWFQVGGELRWSDASAEFEDEGKVPLGKGKGSSSNEFDSGGIHYGVTLGVHW